MQQSAYTDYNVEDILLQLNGISLKAMRKKNSKGKDKPWIQYIKQHIRHYIETVFSGITCVFPAFNSCCYLRRVFTES